MTFLTSTMLAAGIAALAIGAGAPASAAPVSAGLTAIQAAPVVIRVQGRDRHRGPGHNANRRPGGGHHGHRPNRHRNDGARDAAIAAGVLGIVGGLIAAGAAQPQPAWPRHCYRMADFDPRDGSYIDHRGRVRYCR